VLGVGPWRRRQVQAVRGAAGVWVVHSVAQAAEVLQGWIVEGVGGWGGVGVYKYTGAARAASACGYRDAVHLRGCCWRGARIMYM
jgi:hypothetical protein